MIMNIDSSLQRQSPGIRRRRVHHIRQPSYCLIRLLMLLCIMSSSRTTDRQATTTASSPRYFAFAADHDDTSPVTATTENDQKSVQRRQQEQQDGAGGGREEAKKQASKILLSSSSSATRKQLTLQQIFVRAGKRGLGGGIPGAMAGIVQVLSLMWLRTVTNYQCRYGTSLKQSLITLLNEGGIPRLYRGMGFALIQTPISYVSANGAFFLILFWFPFFCSH
jgi:hypothetical protein